MKNIIKLASLVLACIMLVSCGNTAHTTITTENTSSQASTQIPLPSPNNSLPPKCIQAIVFNRDFDEAKKFIETNDLSDTSPYYEDLFGAQHETIIAINRNNIQKMIDAFRGDGYITKVTAEDADKVEFRALMPYLEDVRTMPKIAHYVQKGDYNCYFEIRFADPSILEIVEGREDFEKAYLIERYREYSLFDENCQVVDYTGNNLGAAKKLYVSTDGNIYFWLDNMHFVYARPTEDNKDIATFVEFAKTLTFEQVPLEK